MKKNIIFFFSLNLFFSSFSQDIIYKKDGEKINGKVIEITVDAVKYNSIDDSEGPLRTIPSHEIYMIKYENGKEEIFKVEGAPVAKSEKFFSDKKNKYFSIASGFGQSYGGLGIRLQGRNGKILGFGYHLGIGYIPPSEESGGSEIFYSFGLKFFWYKALYLNLQYGPTATCKENYVVYNHYYNYYSYYEEKIILFGPSMLIGGDWFFNKRFGLNGALGLATNLTNDSYPYIFATIDLGFIVKF